MHCCSSCETIVILAALLFLSGNGLGAAAFRTNAQRSLLATIQPDEPSKTIYFDSNLKRGSPDIAADDERVLKASPGCAVPEQVGLGQPDRVGTLLPVVSLKSKQGQFLQSGMPIHLVALHVPLSVNHLAAQEAKLESSQHGLL